MFFGVMVLLEIKGFPPGNRRWFVIAGVGTNVKAAIGRNLGVVASSVAHKALERAILSKIPVSSLISTHRSAFHLLLSRGF
jgi:hypothetical protein